MFNLEKLLASKLLAKKKEKDIISTNIIIDNENGKIMFILEVKTGKILKSGKEQIKVYKNDISKYVKNHGGLEAFFKSLVVAEMITIGYSIIPIENGYLCVGGEEVYSMTENECTCPAFINNPSHPCKHLLYKDGLLEQRARINKWREEFLN